MTTVNADQVREEIKRAQQLPRGRAQIAAVEAAVAQADAIGDADAKFAARMLATEAYHFGGEPAKSFVTFSWCLAEFDANPTRFGREHDWHLRWQYKWIGGSLSSFPEIGLEQTYKLLDDMERRYREGGHSLHAVYALRLNLARHLGDDDAADALYAQWSAATRDENSNCPGCDPLVKVSYLYEQGRAAEAVADAEPILAGRLTCPEQPHSMLTALLLPYLRVGQLDRAREAHTRAYRAVRDKLADLEDIADHIFFCAVTGNELRGLELIRRHLDWLEHPPSPFAGMEFASAAALVLRRLTDAGHGDQVVRRRGGEVTVAALAQELAAAALAVAARFDARNGNDYQSGRVQMRLMAQRLVELPLTPIARTRPAPAAPVLAPLPTSTDPDELVEALERLRREDRDADWLALIRHCEHLHAETAFGGPALARLQDAQAAELANRGELDAAAGIWRQAAATYASNDEPVRAAICRSALGLIGCMSGEDDAAAGLAEIETEREYVLAHGNPRQRTSVHLRLVHALLVLDRAGDALPVLEQAMAAAAESADDRLLTGVRIRLAQAHQVLGHQEQALAAAQDAFTAAGQVGGELIFDAGMVLAQVVDHESHAERLAILEQAIAVAPDNPTAINAWTLRAQTLRALDRAVEAIPDYVEALGLCTEFGIAEAAAFVRFELADTYYAVDRPVEAAEVGEEALPALLAVDAVDAADRCRYLLVNAYRDLGESDSALRLLDELAVNLSGFDNLVEHGRMCEEAGDLLYQLDRDGQAAEKFAAAATAYTQAEQPLHALRARRRRAVALHWSGDTDGSVAALEQAEAALAALAAPWTEQPQAVWERALLGADGARVMIGAGRLDDARERVEPVPAALRGIEAFGEAFGAELLLAEVLLRADRASEAEPVLRSVVTGLPRNAPMLAQAVGMLSDCLAHLGRTDEAEKLRAEYGLAE